MLLGGLRTGLDPLPSRALLVICEACLCMCSCAVELFVACASLFVCLRFSYFTTHANRPRCRMLLGLMQHTTASRLMSPCHADDP